MSKPIREPQVYEDDLPSLNSDDDREETSDDSDAEMPYESVRRNLPAEWKMSERTEIRALPIKLADGRIKDVGVKVVLDESEGESDSEVNDESEEMAAPARENVSTGARFGRPAIVDVLRTKSRKQKVKMAKEQIAGICQEILADPENSVSVDNFLIFPSIELS